MTWTIPADELVASIKMAMEDKAMAANLEKIHQIYMDREEKPVEKVTMINMLLFDDIGDDDVDVGGLVGGVRLPAWNRQLAQVHWRGGDQE